MYLEWEAFHKTYYNVASPEGARLIRRGIWVWLKRLGNLIFLFLHQSACAKKPCRNNSTYRNGFINKRYQCLCSAGFKGRTRDEGNIRLHVISFMEQMSVFPSVTILVWSCISGKWGLIEMNWKKTNQHCWCSSQECYALYESNWNQVLNFNTLYFNEVESRRHKRVYRGNIQLQRWCCVQQY